MTAVAWIIPEQFAASGSEWYRVHRPAQLCAAKVRGWASLVAVHMATPQRSGEPWLVGVPDDKTGDMKALAPRVLIMRPITRMGDGDPDDPAGISELVDAVAWAKEAGQVVLVDMDDDPWSWVDYRPETKWGWELFNQWVGQADAMLCSTQALAEVCSRRYPDMPIVVAPNCYDPDRYAHVKPVHAPIVGAHINVETRSAGDLELLGRGLRDAFALRGDLRFHHRGERFPCLCGHGIFDHRSPDEGVTITTCKRCENAELWRDHLYVEAASNGLARLSGLPESAIVPMRGCSLQELPDAMSWSIGAIPLSEAPFNRAKTETKGFEMAAAGIPFVAITGDHPLYLKSPGYAEVSLASEAVIAMCDDPALWEGKSVQFRQWANLLAQRHEIDYLDAVTSLARMDLVARR